MKFHLARLDMGNWDIVETFETEQAAKDWARSCQEAMPENSYGWGYGIVRDGLYVPFRTYYLFA